MQKKHDMPPPPSRQLKKTILEEDEYVAALEKIIGRDFYPDVPKLREQLAWLKGVNPKDAAIARRVIQTEQRRWGAAATPILQALDDDGNINEGASETVEVEDETTSLSAFIAKHSSEDNESFQQLLVKMQEEHRRKYWWAHEGSDKPLYVLTNGERIEGEARLRLEAAAANRPTLGDGRPAAPDSWKFVTRNQLMFRPQLAVSNITCGVESTAQLLIESDSAGGKDNGRVGAPVKEPIRIQHSSTRIPINTFGTLPGASHILTSGKAAAPSPLERPNSERSSVAELEMLEGREAGARRDIVPMTPLLEPGGGGESPIMTWGSIEGTPMILDAASSSSVAIADVPTFRIGSQSSREALGHKLAGRTRIARQAAADNIQQAKATSVSRRMLTPAAKSLAARIGLSTGAGTPFGGGLKVKTPASAAAGSIRAQLHTPLASPSPMRKVSSKKTAKSSSSASGGNTEAKPRVVVSTDGLLKL